MEDAKSVNISVNCDRALAWRPATHNLFTSCPKLIRRLLTQDCNVEFLKIWWRYGSQADRAEKKWAAQMGKAGELQPLGVLAIEALYQGMAHVPWDAFMSALRLDASFEVPDGGSAVEVPPPAPLRDRDRAGGRRPARKRRV